MLMSWKIDCQDLAIGDQFGMVTGSSIGVS